MNRQEMLGRVSSRQTPWDMIIIGGGATGVGVAIDAAARGFEVLLLEAQDFGKGTSSRSTKLIHGGVRYLEQGNISLVMEALKERGLLRQNAPHLVHDLAFIVPNYSWWEAPFYGIGMKVYDLLAGKYGFGRSRILSAEETIEKLPNLQTDGLRGGVIYYDGQFDDTRLLIHMAASAADHGATLLNYAPVLEILKDADGFANGVVLRDEESGGQFTAAAQVVINATGMFADRVRRMTDPEAQKHRQQSMILVPRDTPGVTVVRPLTVFGYDDRDHGGHAEILFDHVRVPAANLIAEEGAGFAIAQARLGPGRNHHCMRLLGMAERSVELMNERARSRVAFGRSLGDQGVVREWVAESRIAIESLRLLVLKTAWLMDTVGNRSAMTEIQSIKVAVPRAVQQIIDHAIQLFGGAGLSEDEPLAEMFAVARALRLADGPDEVHLSSLGAAQLRLQRNPGSSL